MLMSLIYANIRHALTRYIDNLVLVLYKPDSSHNQQFKTTQSVSVATPNISDLRSPLDRKPVSGCHVTVAFYNSIKLYFASTLEAEIVKRALCVVIPVPLAGGQCLTWFDGEPTERELLTAAVYNPGREDLRERWRIRRR